MALTRSILEALAVPLNRRDFEAFVQAVERLPSSDRNILAVIGAGHVLGSAPKSRNYLRNPASLQAQLADFQRATVDETELTRSSSSTLATALSAL
jgi:hypothetical protein